MLLNVGERTALLKVLPVKEEYERIKAIHELQGRLMLTTKEVEEYEFKLEESLNLYVWNDKGRNNPVEINISVLQLKIIKETLHDLRKEVTISMISVWERFMR